jgi:anti-sigma factor RsiW
MTMTDHLACPAFDAAIVPYLARKLDADERARFEAHRDICARCHAQFEKIRDAAYLDCIDLVELVTDYLEDRLPPVERERFETHLALCKGCDAYVEQMRATIRLTGQLAEDDVPAPVRETLLEAFRGWKRG